MIDLVKLEASLQPINLVQQGEFLQLGKLLLVPCYCKRTYRILKYEFQEKGLLFSVFGNNLKVTNSLHKFHKGNNYSDFSFSEIRSAIEQIEWLTEITASDFKIIRLEFGFNIELDSSANDYLPLFLDYKGRERDKMRANQIWYGVKFPLTEFALKFYDKNAQTKIKDRLTIGRHLMRVEIQISKMRVIRNILNLNDLLNQNNLRSLFSDFIKKIKAVNCDDDINLTCLSSHDRELFFASKNPMFWNLEKKLNVYAAKYKRKRLKKMKETLISKSIIDIFIQKLEKKFEELITQ